MHIHFPVRPGTTKVEYFYISTLHNHYFLLLLDVCQSGKANFVHQKTHLLNSDNVLNLTFITCVERYERFNNYFLAS